MISSTIKVAVIGRPNVGKSTLFNRLLKERRSIVADEPGVTRDRIYAEVEWNGKAITLVDTGGLVEQNGNLVDEITLNIKKHIYAAIDESNFLIFLVDGKTGITSQDKKIADYLRKIKSKKKIFLAVNKIDTEKQIPFIYEFYSLGLGDPYPVSALVGSQGLADILDEIISYSKNIDTKKNEYESIKVAIVGKPNTGKSSILNCLVGKERSIVTSIAGTTRDSIDTEVLIDKKCFTLIDTAGLRRKSKVSSVVERYATSRAISAIEKADVILLVVDAKDTISNQDQKIASLIKNRNKPSVILVNKWDLIQNKKADTVSIFEEKILTSLRFIDYSKVLLTSALQKKNIHKVWDLVLEANENNEKRISTGKLNRAIEEIILATSPPSKKGKQLKIYYVTQSNVKPPEIVFFVNDSKLINKQYQKFLEKEIRKRFDFSGCPIQLIFRNKSK